MIETTTSDVIAALVPMLLALASAAVCYGVLRGRVESHAERIRQLEERIELEANGARHISERLARIETKIDLMMAGTAGHG